MPTVLITGANRGIGLELARQYVRSGAHVIACCRSPRSADGLRLLAAEFGNRVEIAELDVESAASLSALKREIGSRPIDILINNAGINGTPKDQTADRIDPENWMRTMQINALAPILIAQAFRDNLVAGSEKKLVAIGSVYASMGKDYGAGHQTGLERYAYRASKAALNNGMCGLARDWAHLGVIVGILDPGFAQTDMTGEAARSSSLSVTAAESASGLISRIAELGPETSGVFQRYWGEAIPW